MAEASSNVVSVMNSLTLPENLFDFSFFLSVFRRAPLMHDGTRSNTESLLKRGVLSTGVFRLGLGYKATNIIIMFYTDPSQYEL